MQEAWDKQATFMKAQARAQAELRGLVKQYNEMLHENWDLATEEQKARVRKLEAEAERQKIEGGSKGDDLVDDWISGVYEEEVGRDE